MHDGMQYDPIQGPGQGHEPFKIWSFSKAISHLEWELTTDGSTAEYLNLFGPDF